MGTAAKSRSPGLYSLETDTFLCRVTGAERLNLRRWSVIIACSDQRSKELSRVCIEHSAISINSIAPTRRSPISYFKRTLGSFELLRQLYRVSRRSLPVVGRSRHNDFGSISARPLARSRVATTGEIARQVAGNRQMLIVCSLACQFISSAIATDELVVNS